MNTQNFQTLLDTKEIFVGPVTFFVQALEEGSQFHTVVMNCFRKSIAFPVHKDYEIKKCRLGDKDKVFLGERDGKGSILLINYLGYFNSERSPFRLHLKQEEKWKNAWTPLEKSGEILTCFNELSGFIIAFQEYFLTPPELVAYGNRLKIRLISNI